MKILATVLSVVGISILAFVAVYPQKKRQDSCDRRFKGRKIAGYAIQNRPRLKQQYEDFVAKGYPYTRVEDRKKCTEESYVNLHAKSEVENMFLDGRLKYPSMLLTDARLIVIGAILQGLSVLIQLWLNG